MTTDVRTDDGRSLRRLFEELVWRHFYADMHLEEPTVAQYVSTLLADFAEAIGSMPFKMRREDRWTTWGKCSLNRIRH